MTGGKNRGIRQLCENQPGAVAEALRRAGDAARTGDTSAGVSALRELRGVGVATATAILTWMDPERYTMLSVPALRALGRPATTRRSSELYAHYLPYCVALAEKTKVELRTLDRAFWQWAKDNPE